MWSLGVELKTWVSWVRGPGSLVERGRWRGMVGRMDRRAAVPPESSERRKARWTYS